MSNAFMKELPIYYEDIREFQELSETVVVDWDKLDEALFGIESMEDDQFVLTSSEGAIARREKDFGIVADSKKESLNFRKLRILARMQENAPYVLEYLQKLLSTLLGYGNFTILLNIDEFEMKFMFDAELSAYLQEVKNLLERIVPLNIDIMLVMYLLGQIQQEINNVINIRIYIKATLNPWAFVGSGGYGSEKILLDGKYNLDGERFLNSYYNTSGPDYLTKIRLVMKVLHEFGTEINVSPILDGEYYLDGEILLQNEPQTVILPIVHNALINYKQRELIDVSATHETPILYSSKTMSGVHTLNGANDLNGNLSLDQALLENSGFLRVKKSGVIVEEVAI